MKLKTNPDNPRTISKDKYDKLKRSIERNPDGLTANKIGYKDDIIISGNQRYRAIVELGLEHKPEWFKDLSGWTQEQIDEWVIQSNLSAGEWDWDMLANEWDETELEDWGLDTTQEWDNKKELPETIDDIPEPPKDPITKLGDIWLLGNHRVICGDSTDKATVEKLMDGKKADMVFTDPPYGMEYKGEVFGKQGISNDGAGWKDVTKKALEILPIDNGVVAICFAPSRLKDFFECVGKYDFHRRLTIYKPNRMAKPWRGWIMTMEDIYLFSIGEPTWNSVDHKHDVYTHDYSERPDREVDHPTVKPLSIVVDVIKKTSADKSLIYDAFFGSGSTLIACEQTDRICYGLELDPLYVDVICKRWQTLTGELPILESTGEAHDFIG